MYCMKCGREMEETWLECPSCHERVLTKETILNKGSKWWGLLGFAIPNIGIVLFIAWVKIKPTAALSAIIGAVIGILVRSVS